MESRPRPFRLDVADGHGERMCRFAPSALKDGRGPCVRSENRDKHLRGNRLLFTVYRHQMNSIHPVRCSIMMDHRDVCGYR